jgi:lysozyme
LDSTAPSYALVAVLSFQIQGAITSFAYNLGANFYGGEKFHHITEALSSVANWGNVPSAMAMYCNPGSKVEAGLKRRRAAEAALWQEK